MSNFQDVYNVKAGEKLTVIAPRYNVTATAILQANPSLYNNLISLEGFPQLHPGMKLNIPFPQDAELMNRRDPISIDSATASEITVLIDGVQFSTWETAEINRQFDVAADTFSLSGPIDAADRAVRAIFKPFTYKPFSLYVGSEKIMQGSIINHNPESAANQSSLKVSGYSTPGILQDVMLPPTLYPFETDGWTLQQIAQRACTPFGITVLFTDSDIANTQFSTVRFESVTRTVTALYGQQVEISAGYKRFVEGERIDISPIEKIYPFLIGLAQQVGLVISSDVQGRLLFQKPTNEPAADTIIAGQSPFVKSSAKYLGQNRHSTYTALGTEMLGGVGAAACQTDLAIQNTGINRPYVFKARDTNAGSLQNAAIAEYGRALARAINITITVTGWRRPSDDKLWKDNTRVIYQNPKDFIYEQTEFLVRAVKFIKGPKTEVTELTLVFPEAYNGEVRSSFPWD